MIQLGKITKREFMFIDELPCGDFMHFTMGYVS